MQEYRIAQRVLPEQRRVQSPSLLLKRPPDAVIVDDKVNCAPKRPPQYRHALNCLDMLLKQQTLLISAIWKQPCHLIRIEQLTVKKHSNKPILGASFQHINTSINARLLAPSNNRSNKWHSARFRWSRILLPYSCKVNKPAYNTWFSYHWHSSEKQHIVSGHVMYIGISLYVANNTRWSTPSFEEPDRKSRVRTDRTWICSG